MFDTKNLEKKRWLQTLVDRNDLFTREATVKTAAPALP